MPAIRRFRFDRVQGRVVEVPLTRDESDFVQARFRLHWSTRQPAIIGRDLSEGGIEIHGGDARSESERATLISPVPHPERIRLEGLLALFEFMDLIEQGFGRDRSSPGAAVDAENLEKTLVDLARDGKKDDFYFLAQASAGIPQGKLDEVWTGARRRLRLVP